MAYRRDVWVLAVTGGGFRARDGELYELGVLVLDAETGQALSESASSTTDHPAFFDAIADQAGAPSQPATTSPSIRFTVQPNPSR